MDRLSKEIIKTKRRMVVDRLSKEIIKLADRLRTAVQKKRYRGLEYYQDPKYNVWTVIHEDGTEFIVALDDSKSTGRRLQVDEVNNEDGAKKYIDWYLRSKRTSSERYELYFSSGGHSGPYMSKKQAMDYAERYLRGDNRMQTVEGRPVSNHSVEGFTKANPDSFYLHRSQLPAISWKMVSSYMWDSIDNDKVTQEAEKWLIENKRGVAKLNLTPREIKDRLRNAIDDAGENVGWTNFMDDPEIVRAYEIVKDDISEYSEKSKPEKYLRDYATGVALGGLGDFLNGGFYE